MDRASHDEGGVLGAKTKMKVASWSIRVLKEPMECSFSLRRRLNLRHIMEAGVGELSPVKACTELDFSMARAGGPSRILARSVLSY